MPIFQRPASTPAELAASAPLALSPDEVANLDEDAWYERVYRGDDIPQLTVRAVLMGSLLGFFLAFTNLYVGLKTGWGLGVALTACILSYSIWTFLQKVGVAKTPMTILENNCMQSTASAAGYGTVGTIVSAIPALLMLSATPEQPGGAHLPWGVLAAWTALTAVLGTVIAIPLKRNMINQERLKFPSGLAAAATLQSLYASGAEAMRKAKALFIAAFVGGLVPPLIDLNATKEGPLLPTDSPLFDGWMPVVGDKVKDGQSTPMKASDWTMTMDHNPVMIAAGAIIGLRTALSMMVGALILIYIAGPMGLDAPWTNAKGTVVNAVTKGTSAWKEIGLWLGAPMLVAAGLTSFALQYKTILRAFKGVLSGGGEKDVRKAAVEVPTSWFAIGFCVAGAGIVFVGAMYFGVPVHLGLLALLMTFALALVACRATGESDITPVGAMGKIMQLTYGVLIPQSATANLMTAAITSNAAGSSADLLNDLKSGYLLGANPRRQFLAQLAGVWSGTIATVVGFYTLVPDATALTGKGGAAPQFPAPAAQAWRAVAELFRDGIANMHPMNRQAIFVGIAVGVAFTLIEAAAGKSRRFLPSPTGIGLGLILPFQYPFSMFLGAAIAAAWNNRWPTSAKDYLIPVAAGLIAGVSIVGVIVAFLNNFIL